MLGGVLLVQCREKPLGEPVAAMLRQRADQFDLGDRQPGATEAPVLPDPDQARRRPHAFEVLGDEEVARADPGMAVEHVVNPGGDAGMRAPTGHRL